MNIQTKDLLKEFDLRTTSCRTEILSLFMEKVHALSHSDIEHTLSESHDRVTVYRTLKTFLDKGILHKVLDDSGSAKYALCKDSCTMEDHNHEHVHFKCLKCGMTNCLDNVEVPAITLPSGYKAIETNLLVQGTCNSCN
ncbi:MAG: transcriptional repressor [Bacteroidota bacterium]|nr:transcriptional repressor [Bacteroidota bacterium]